MRVRTVAALGALAWMLAACGGDGEVYSMPASKVESRLRSMALPSEMGFGAGGGSDATVESASTDAVRWRISDRGATLGWLEADLEAIDLEHTRVKVEFEAADTLANSGQQKFLSAVGGIALAEAIDAELDGRAFDKRRLETKIAAYALTHRDEVATWDLDERGLSDALREQQIASVAGKDPQAGVMLREYETQQKMKAASEPSLKLDADD